jgi:hypothetical protein
MITGRHRHKFSEINVPITTMSTTNLTRNNLELNIVYSDVNDSTNIIFLLLVLISVSG